MLVDKYVIWMPSAIRRVSKRMGIPVPSGHQICILYMLKRRGQLRFTAITAMLDAYGHSDHDTTTNYSLKHLISYGLVVKSEGGYAISASGREFISYIRNYLLNKRIY